MAADERLPRIRPRQVWLQARAPAVPQTDAFFNALTILCVNMTTNNWFEIQRCLFFVFHAIEV